MVLRLNIQILNVSNIDFALSMIYGLSIRHIYSSQFDNIRRRSVNKKSWGMPMLNESYYNFTNELYLEIKWYKVRNYRRISLRHFVLANISMICEVLKLKVILLCCNFRMSIISVKIN